jgi:hypothetical protein
MKIRFYHMWVYRLYFWIWTPILRSRPMMLKGMIEYQIEWLNRREDEVKQARSKFKVIK